MDSPPPPVAAEVGVEVRMPVFKDENRALQELVRELILVRNHNLTFKDGDPLQNVLLFAEAGLVCMTFEHFVRVVVGNDGPAGATLFNLLEIAVSKGLIRLPWDDQQDGIKKVCAVRNTILHGNYAQAAREAGKASVAEYFKTVFASEIEVMFKVVDHLMKQIDVNTGKPFAKT
jgi:hypothetical protein